MVKFGWPVKTSKSQALHPEKDAYAPPQLQEGDHVSPLVIPSPTMFAVPTTNTTQPTHFFTLPLWRKRQEQQVGPTQHPSMSDSLTHQLSSDHQLEHGAPIPNEKALPPTPTSSTEGASGAHLCRVDSPIEDQSLLYQPSRQAPQSTTASPTTRPSPSKAKLALAQAALAIGLPHSMPQASASSSRSDVNSIAFVPIPQSSLHGLPPSSLRRAKSFQQLTREYGKEDDTHTGIKRSRSRGISFGRVNAFDSDEKGKGKALEDIPSHVTPPRRSLARRASFWNRKHHESSKPSVAPLPLQHPHNSADNLSHTLPSLPPMSPFHFDTDVSHSSRSSHTEEQLPHPPPGLNSHCDHRDRPLPARPAASSPDLSLRPLQPHPPRQLRPATADSATDRPRTLSSFTPPSGRPSTSIFTSLQYPDAAARRRSQTNPPFFHRLSVNLFSFGSSSSSLSTSGTNGAHLTHSPGASPRASTSKLSPPKPRLSEESPASYMNRLLSTISKVEVASVLASSGESFYTNALKAYIDRFEFDSDPLDVALRKLLMDVGLPRETQQIDRVMEAFASRYLICNRSLFTSDDHPYILAFSLIMLHTDAFNKSNKRKMTKADYIRNTKLPGIYPEVLDYYYDNIVFAPFVFVEDPVEVNLQRNVDSGPSRLLAGISPQHSLPGNGSSVTLLGKSNKVDPYYLIAKNLLDPLRVDVEEYTPLENCYSYNGTLGPWNEEDMHETFSKAGTIKVRGADRRMSTSVFALGIGGFSTTYSSHHQPSGSAHTHQESALRVARAGLLNRRDTTLDIGKRAKAGKWRLWSVILTSSQLLFFRDRTWAISLGEQMGYRDGRILVPPVSLLKPDEVFPLKDSVALYDRSYDKGQTFLFIAGDRRPFLLQAAGEEDMNNWISCINYASAFKTTGVSMRAPDMSGKDVELMGVAAAASHLQDLQCANTDSRPSHVRSCGRNSDGLIDRFSASSSAPYAISRSGGCKILRGHEDMDLDVPAAPNLVGVHQLKATFDQVKADLATGQWTSADASTPRTDGRPRAHSLESAALPRLASFPETSESEHDRVSIRTRDIRSKLAELDSKISSLQLQEESDVRLLRNISILTPFQRATRERLGTVVLQISKGIQRTRLELGMRLCHKEVLSNDLISQEREWHRTKKIALKAATDTLQRRCEPSITGIPLLRVDEPLVDSSDRRRLPESPLPPESSIAESFYTALDFDCRICGMGEHLDSPLSSPQDWMLTDSPSSSSHTQANGGNSTRETGTSHGVQEESGEEAEEWNKTRAAKRVSLVRMPSALNVPLGRHSAVSATGSVWTTRSSRSMHEP